MPRRFPDWLKKNLSVGHEAARTDALLKDLGLHTICESGKCPNRDECYSQGTATFMIMGELCTRRCGYCSVTTARPEALEADEPRRVAEAAKLLGLKHVVVTSVNRDDLEDEGAGHFVRVVEELKKLPQDPIVEILTPDFRRTQKEAVARLIEAGPHIFNHNVETVPSLYRSVRPQGDYARSLEIFRQIRSHSKSILTKSGLMLGLGETRAEVLCVFRELREAGCDILTLGQYLQPTALHLPVDRYVSPEEFEEYKREALGAEFRYVESAPYVRSSFHAKDTFERLKRELEVQRG